MQRLVRRTMYISLIGILMAVGSGLGPGLQAASATDESVAAQFTSPSAEFRPKIRWWLPTTKLDDDQIRREIKSMADAGIGGIEVQAYPVEDSNTPTHAWGTPEWNKRMQAALEAAKKHGLTVDMTLGPRYPSAVPSISKEDPAAAKELLYGKAVIAGGSTYNAAVPALIEVPLDGLFGGPARQPGTPALVAVTAARVAPGSSAAEAPVKLDPASLVNITHAATNGQLNWTAPAGGEWIIFSFWQRSTGQVVAGTPTPAYAVDHFSAAGTKTMTNYWENQLLTPAVRDLLRQTGGDFAEDSLELLSALHWTPNMREEFKAASGYDVTPYLPVLFIPRLHDFMGVIGGATVDSPPAFALADGNDSRVRNDYYRTLTKLYERHHLDGLKAWSNKQGLQLRVQPAYGATLDMASATTHVDVPETEQFHFKDTIDSYRAMAGAAHVSNKPVVSSEIAPMATGMLQDAYGTSWKRMLEISNQNFAGGVNQVVWHGFPYADGPGATWPGWYPFATPFAPGFGEAWGPRQPSWKHMPDINGYVSRQQAVLQAGKPRVDIALYRQSYWDGPSATVLYNDPGLERAGYSYEFVGASLLRSPTKVNNGRLAADGPAYRALVLNNQTVMPLDTAKQILAYAQQGLPVVVVGQPPATTPYFHNAARQDAELRQTITQLLAQRSVTRIANTSELAGALAGKNIQPAARYHNAPSGLLNVHRAAKDADYYYFFNNSSAAIDREVSLEGKGQVFALNAWTGGVTPLPSSQGTSGTKTIRVQLKPQDTLLVTVGSVKNFEQSTQSTPEDDAMGQPQQLSSWHLSVEDWRPGATASETIKVNHEMDLTELKPWTDIPELQDVSGIGRYTTQVTWNKSAGRSAHLDLGTFYGTARVYVNGQAAGPVNLNNPKVELRRYLKDGQNTITVEIATTLRNRLRTIHPGQATAPRQPYGLIGPVQLMSHKN